MPLEPGYGRYPINKSVPISASMNAEIERIAARRGVSQSEVIRLALEAGLPDIG